MFSILFSISSKNLDSTEWTFGVVLEPLDNALFVKDVIAFLCNRDTNGLSRRIVFQTDAALILGFAPT